MAVKFYAVKAGREIGIYESWDACKSQIDGFKGAKYKSFKTIDEARGYIGSLPHYEQLQFEINENELPHLENYEMAAYVDGSYNLDKNIYGAGLVIIFQGSVKELCLTGEDEALATMRNVAGEIMASRMAMEIALLKGAKVLHLYFDYEGIEKWCIGRWQTNTTATREYKEYYENIKGKLKVIFNKVAAHSGVKMNEMADKLAKEAAGVK